MESSNLHSTTDKDEASAVTLMEALRAMSVASKTSAATTTKPTSEVDSDEHEDSPRLVLRENEEEAAEADPSNALYADSPRVDVLDPIEGAKLPYHLQCRLMKSSSSTAHFRSEGYRPAHIAARLGRAELFWWLVNHEEDFISRTSTGYSVFHLAAEYGHLALAQGIYERFGNQYGRVEKRVELRTRTVNKNSALHLAAAHGHLDVVVYLTTVLGFSVREKNSELHTPLMVAAQGGHLEVVQHLHSKSRASLVEVGQYKYTALLLAAYHGHKPVVVYCLDHGSSPNEKTNLHNTALHVACMGGHTHLVSYLLLRFKDGTLDPHSKNANGQTPLHLAAWAGHTELALLLFSAYGASLTATNAKGNTPFLMSCLRGHLSVAKALIKLGASFNERNASQNTGLLLAAYGGHNDVIEWLLDPETKSGLDITQTSASGNTPFLQAAYQAHLHTIKYLYETVGADLHERNHAGRSAIDLAEQYGDMTAPIVLYLREQGAASSESGDSDSIAPEHAES